MPLKTLPTVPATLQPLGAQLRCLFTESLGDVLISLSLQSLILPKQIILYNIYMLLQLQCLFTEAPGDVLNF